MPSDSEDVDGRVDSHCTLCALGIPDHVVSQTLSPARRSSVEESFDPVTIYLQRRRVGSKTTTGTRAM